MTHKILYIEDSPHNIALIEKYLKFCNCKVTSEYHAATGIRRAMITRPDLIIVDVHLPDDNGVAVISKLRHLDGMQLTPIIALTAMDTMSIQRDCLDAGASAFLRKPISKVTLLDTLTSFLPLVEVR